jgi:tetratricopeptide (TPR) repeat protein
MHPDHWLASPADWDALTADKDHFPALQSELQAMEPSGLRNARLAQLFLLKGEVSLAAEVLRRPFADPLIRATRINLLDVQQRFQETLGFDPRLPESNEPLVLEARARTHAHLAKAHIYLHQYTQALDLLTDARQAARACGMVHYATLCELLEDECVSSHTESGSPESREQFLREFIATAPSEESRLEAHMRLIRLLYRQGHYQKTLRMALEVPRELHGQGFVELGLILNHLDDQTDWSKITDTAQLGRLRTVKGMLTSNPEFILDSPPPRDCNLHPRPMAEWHVGFGWAYLKHGQFKRALEHFQSSFIHRSEWDLRMLRNMCLLELLFEDPGLLEGHNLVALAEETRWLLLERIHPQAIAHQILPRATPQATVLLLSFADAPELEVTARQTLALVSPQGIEIRGVLHTEAQSMVRVIEGTTDQEPRMHAGAVRSAKLRLKLLLQGHGDPLLVRTSKVAAVLERICAQAEGNVHTEWLAKLEAHRQRYVL